MNRRSMLIRLIGVITVGGVSGCLSRDSSRSSPKTTTRVSDTMPPVANEPRDIYAINKDAEPHTITITIQNGEQFSREVTLEAATVTGDYKEGSSRILEDVISKKGMYTVTARLATEQSAQFVWLVRDSSQNLIIRIKEDRSIQISETPRL